MFSLHGYPLASAGRERPPDRPSRSGRFVVSSASSTALTWPLADGKTGTKVRSKQGKERSTADEPASVGSPFGDPPARAITKIGLTITALCDELGLSLDELARRAGISRRTVRNILQGRNRPKKDSLRRIADALGVSLGQLISSPNPPPLDLPQIASDPSALRAASPRTPNYRDSPGAWLAFGQYTNALTALVTQSSSREPFFASVGQADFLSAWLARLYEQGLAMAEPKILSVTIRALGDNVIDTLVDRGQLPASFKTILKVNLDSIANILARRGIPFRLQPWQLVPPFHGFLYGTDLFLGQWATGPDGHMHVRTPLQHLTRDTAPDTYRQVLQAFES